MSKVLCRKCQDKFRSIGFEFELFSMGPSLPSECGFCHKMTEKYEIACTGIPAMFMDVIMLERKVEPMILPIDALSAIDRMVYSRKIDRITIDHEQPSEIMLVDQYRTLHISPQLWGSLVEYCTKLSSMTVTDTPQIATLFGIPVN